MGWIQHLLFHTIYSPIFPSRIQLFWFTVLLLCQCKLHRAGFFLCFSESSKKCQHSQYTELPGSAPEEIVLIKVTAAELEPALRRRRYYRLIH